MHLRPVYKPERSFLRESLHFSFGNYIGQTFIWAPTYLLPLLILGTLGAQQAAYYYVAYSVFTILSIVPNAISTSLFVEGSHGENLEIILRKSIRTTLLLLTPLVVVVFIGGKWILSIFGLEYAMGGLELLQVISLASYFVALNYVYIAVLRIRNEIRRIVFLSFIILVSLMSSATILSSEMGLIGIGYSWIIAYGLGCIAILFMIMFPKEEGIP
jgi:O-antigen/teichoic acid export membrane protein